jgi:hypothetical protein
MDAIQVRDSAELLSITKEIAGKFSNSRILFRGQTSDRTIVPSIFRGKTEASDKFPGCIPSLTANWSVLAEKIMREFREGDSAWIETQAVMQHYGYRSTFVDVTSSLDIALWFALHKFTSYKAPVFINNKLRSAVFQCSSYVNSNKGYIYFLKLPDESDQQYIDLTQVMPSTAGRIHSQKAGGIVCSSERPTADNLIIAKVELTDEGWYKGSKSDLPLSELFPSPRIDLFYRKMCSIPYYITPQRENMRIPIGHPLLGMFPIYAQSIKELLVEYTPLTTIIETHPSLKWNIASGAIKCDNELFKARSSQRISISKLLVDSLIEDTYKEDNLSDLPSRNIIFEFEPEGSLFSPLSKALEKVVLGVWVIVGENTLKITEIVDNFVEVYFDNPLVYSLESRKWIKKSGIRNEYYLQMLHAVSSLLKTKKLKLMKADKLYSRISYSKQKMK